MSAGLLWFIGLVLLPPALFIGALLGAQTLFEQSFPASTMEPLGRKRGNRLLVATAAAEWVLFLLLFLCGAL